MKNHGAKDNYNNMTEDDIKRVKCKGCQYFDACSVGTTPAEVRATCQDFKKMEIKESPKWKEMSYWNLNVPYSESQSQRLREEEMNYHKLH